MKSIMVYTAKYFKFHSYHVLESTFFYSNIHNLVKRLPMQQTVKVISLDFDYKETAQ